jgi:hypothetical protein
VRPAPAIAQAPHRQPTQQGRRTATQLERPSLQLALARGGQTAPRSPRRPASVPLMVRHTGQMVTVRATAHSSPGWSSRHRRPALGKSWPSAPWARVGRLVELRIVDDGHRIKADLGGDPGQQLVLSGEMALHVRHLVQGRACIMEGCSANHALKVEAPKLRKVRSAQPSPTM